MDASGVGSVGWSGGRLRPRGARVSEDGGREREVPGGRAGAAAPPREGEVFVDLYAAHAEDVERLCRRLLGAREDAEDAAHEAFLKAARGFAAYDPGRPFRTWLLSVAAHHALDRLRRRERERRLFAPMEDDLTAPPDDGPSPLRALLDAEARVRLLRAIDRLPDRYRAPLVLRHLADLSYQEIAELLEISAAQVGVLLHRGRLRLRRAFEEREAAPEDAT